MATSTHAGSPQQCKGESVFKRGGGSRGVGGGGYRGVGGLIPWCRGGGGRSVGGSRSVGGGFRGVGGDPRVGGGPPMHYI